MLIDQGGAFRPRSSGRDRAVRVLIRTSPGSRVSALPECRHISSVSCADRDTPQPAVRSGLPDQHAVVEQSCHDPPCRSSKRPNGTKLASGLGQDRSPRSRNQACARLRRAPRAAGRPGLRQPQDDVPEAPPARPPGSLETRWHRAASHHAQRVAYYLRARERTQPRPAHRRTPLLIVRRDHGLRCLIEQRARPTGDPCDKELWRTPRPRPPAPDSPPPLARAHPIASCGGAVPGRAARLGTGTTEVLGERLAPRRGRAREVLLALTVDPRGVGVAGVHWIHRGASAQAQRRSVPAAENYGKVQHHLVLKPFAAQIISGRRHRISIPRLQVRRQLP